jgi:integrase/recombinase XerC/integrase/recombinase XerD
MDLGLRVSELQALKRSYFRLDDGELLLPGHVQKDYPQADYSPRDATLRLDPYGHFGTVRLLRSYFRSEWYQSKDSEYVLPSRQSEQMTTASIRNVVTDLSIYADITIHRSDGESAEPEDAHPHMFRHSLANYMLQDDDTRFYEVKKRLRHQLSSTTERIYDHFQRR